MDGVSDPGVRTRLEVAAEAYGSELGVGQGGVDAFLREGGPMAYVGGFEGAEGFGFGAEAERAQIAQGMIGAEDVVGWFGGEPEGDAEEF